MLVGLGDLRYLGLMRKVRNDGEEEGKERKGRKSQNERIPPNIYHQNLVVS